MAIHGAVLRFGLLGSLLIIGSALTVPDQSVNIPDEQDAYIELESEINEEILNRKARRIVNFQTPVPLEGKTQPYALLPSLLEAPRDFHELQTPPQPAPVFEQQDEPPPRPLQIGASPLDPIMINPPGFAGDAAKDFGLNQQQNQQQRPVPGVVQVVAGIIPNSAPQIVTPPEPETPAPQTAFQSFLNSAPTPQAPFSSQREFQPFNSNDQNRFQPLNYGPNTFQPTYQSSSISAPANVDIQFLRSGPTQQQTLRAESTSSSSSLQPGTSSSYSNTVIHRG